MVKQLRNYQTKLANDGCEILQRKKIVYLAMEVRTGKSATALEIAKLYDAKKVLFLTKKRAIKSIQDDNIICFDDMERSFKFETLFSIITGNLTLNKKNLQPIEIPFSKSPKIMFTSNYILSGVGDSHDARKIEIELYRHYSKNYKPINEFGKLFFSQWSKDELIVHNS